MLGCNATISLGPLALLSMQLVDIHEGSPKLRFSEKSTGGLMNGLFHVCTAQTKLVWKKVELYSPPPYGSLAPTTIRAMSQYVSWLETSFVSVRALN